MMSDLTAQQIIDHQRYPIADLNSPLRADLISNIQADLAKDGCAVIKNFLSEQGLQDMLNEALARKDQAYYSAKKHCNVYLGDGDDSLPADHPRNVFLPRTNGFITADLLTEDTAARILYHWQPLAAFLADCLGKPELFIYEDPVSNMIVNLGKPGQQFNWHYDTNEFTITMLLKPALSGGHFEYVPNLRTPQDECYDEVRKVLSGDRSRITRLELNAGDLQFFLGRFSLHQVTENTGDDDRLLLIMSFTEKPGVIGSLYRVKDLYGKVTDAHYENERQRVRADELLD
ncbi:HalD/BesD family halogenase [Aliamphritea hakodatensis]|uniref:HalD/BesD family halogenase n=1 Tax=Aliamphritea hakodatensis TaxID=2895352 RepID=UPI0022FD898E|nr:hypothetical protein [Aliamphritea hakodatensis]